MCVIFGAFIEAHSCTFFKNCFQTLQTFHSVVELGLRIVFLKNAHYSIHALANELIHEQVAQIM